MSDMREKQMKLLKSSIVAPLIILVVAWIIFFVIASVQASHDGIPLPDFLWGAIPAAVVVTVLICCLYISKIKMYFALKAIPYDTRTTTKTIQCVKVSFVHNPRSRWNLDIIGVVFKDEQGVKYTYIFEENQYKEKRICAPYKAYQGTSVTLVCYGDTHYVGEIKD